MKNLTIIEQHDWNFFTFYDNDLGTILRDFDGFEYASVQESIDDVAGPYGSVYINSKFGTRRVAIKGDLLGADIFAKRRLLSKALRQTGVIKLVKFTTYDDLNLQFEAEVVKVINPYTHKIHTYLIEMIAPDWRFYSQDLHSQVVGQTITEGGTSIPASIPMSMPSPTSLSSTVTNIITNEGNEITDPILTISGPGTNFTLRNETLEKQIVFTYVLSEGDVVVIDVKRRTAVLNGITNVYQYLAGDFWSLIPGENELRFYVSSGLTVATNLNVSYRDAYSGI